MRGSSTASICFSIWFNPLGVGMDHVYYVGDPDSTTPAREILAETQCHFIFLLFLNFETWFSFLPSSSEGWCVFYWLFSSWMWRVMWWSLFLVWPVECPGVSSGVGRVDLDAFLFSDSDGPAGHDQTPLVARPHPVLRCLHYPPHLHHRSSEADMQGHCGLHTGQVTKNSEKIEKGFQYSQVKECLEGLRIEVEHQKS